MTINIVDEFGRNAGKVWNTLNNYGPLSETKLMNTTLLNENDLYAAIGWLARENKVRKDVFLYKLGETNLSDVIGEKAERIWNILCNQKEVDISSAGKILMQIGNMSEKDVFAALGWLAREGKLETKYVLRPKST
ncbi:MAG: winged helix-turn-helix domain-containing protein [Thermoplasmatota archaeon]